MNDQKILSKRGGFYPRSTRKWKAWMFSLNQILIFNWFYCVGWIENEKGCNPSVNTPNHQKLIYDIYLFTLCFDQELLVFMTICGCVRDLWTPWTVGTYCNKEMLKRYLISATLNSLYVYCCAFITL